MGQRRAVRLAVQPTVRIALPRSAGRTGEAPSRRSTEPSSYIGRTHQHALGRALAMPPGDGRWFTVAMAVSARPPYTLRCPSVQMIRPNPGLTTTRNQHPEPDRHRDVADVAGGPQPEPRPVSLFHRLRDATLLLA